MVISKVKQEWPEYKTHHKRLRRQNTAEAEAVTAEPAQMEEAGEDMEEEEAVEDECVEEDVEPTLVDQSQALVPVQGPAESKDAVAGKAKASPKGKAGSSPKGASAKAKAKAKAEAKAKAKAKAEAKAKAKAVAKAKASPKKKGKRKATDGDTQQPTAEETCPKRKQKKLEECPEVVSTPREADAMKKQSRTRAKAKAASLKETWTEADDTPPDGVKVSTALQRASTQEISAQGGTDAEKSKGDARKEYKARKERFYRSMKSPVPNVMLRAHWLR